MARTVPAPAAGRTVPAPAPGGGGGGGGNPWKSFQDLTNPNNGEWTIIDGSGVNGDTSLTMDGDVLVFNHPTASKLFVQGSTMMGKAMIRSKHLEMVTEAGLQQPAGVASNLLQPEAVVYKMEVQFDTDNGGPINGTATGGTDAYGHKMTVIAGLVGYGSDQNGNPSGFGTNVVWLGSQVYKNSNTLPSADAATSVYRVGWKSYWQNGGTTTGYTWKNQLNAPAAAHDSLIFQLGAVRLQAAAGNSKLATYGGSYAKDQPWNPIGIASNFNWTGMNDNATRYWNAGAQYWHPFVIFGSSNSNVRGNIRIKKINLLLQPLVGRTGIT